MGKLAKELKKILTAHGCRFERQAKGDHELWYSPTTETYFVVDNGTKSHITCNAVLKQAGIKKHF